MLKRQSMSWFVLFIACSVGAALAGETSGDQSSLFKQDQHFLMEAWQGGMMEVQLGQYAAEHASDAEVKSFGKRMVKDHTAINATLAKLARESGMNPPVSLDRQNQKLRDKLTGKTGSEFDTAYMKAMLNDHRMDIEAFEKEAGSTDNARLKKCINDALPTLREHLKLARTIAPTVGVKVEDKD